MSFSPIASSTLGAVRSAYGIKEGLSRPDLKKTEDKDRSPSFEESLEAGLRKINNLQMKAEVAMQDMATGNVDDISEVAAAVSEADLALRFAVQVRDKLLDAYNQLVKISV
jgi:flagellar hook-basal body complex protein FliE